MKKRFVLFGIILMIGLVIGGGQIGELLNSTTDKSIEEKEIYLETEVKNTLANMDSVTETSCGNWVTNCLEWDKPYPEIVCEKWKDEKEGLCEIWVQPKECLEFDKEKGVCNKWDYEPVCVTEEVVCDKWDTNTTYTGISEVIITPKGNNCYDIVSEPFLHRYNTCLSEGENVLVFVKNDLEKIATHLIQEDDTKSRPVLDENVFVVTIK